MPVKILLADKSITIQKVVEMLFSGKEYEVVCVSDGEAGLTEATRIVPDIVLADIDLPKVDGYSLSVRMKQTPALAQTPVILMMSRDDVFDDAKARQTAIADHITKPFESQELIGKVKKAVAGSGNGARHAEAAPAAPKPAPAAPKAQVPPAAAAAPAPPAASKPKAKQNAGDIFDIIQEAPTQADLKKATVSQADEEAIYEVEPVIEVEEPIVPDAATALPEGRKAVEEMRSELGLGAHSAPADEEIVSFESLNMDAGPVKEYVPPRQEPRRTDPVPVLEREAREYVPPPPEPDEALPDGRLQSLAEEIVARVAREHFSKMQPSRNAAPPEPPALSEEMVASAVEQSVSRIVREMAREVIEKVAWEVVPDLAAALIKAEIERLKAEP